jgi:hypothetical protein
VSHARFAPRDATLGRLDRPIRKVCNSGGEPFLIPFADATSNKPVAIIAAQFRHSQTEGSIYSSTHIRINAHRCVCHNARRRRAMDVLFLDVDGVLNTLSTPSSIADAVHVEGCPAPLLASRLRTLTLVLERLPSVRLVISSRWRTEPAAREGLVRALLSHGVDDTRIYDCTPELRSKPRAAEILRCSRSGGRAGCDGKPPGRFRTGGSVEMP